MWLVKMLAGDFGIETLSVNEAQPFKHVTFRKLSSNLMKTNYYHNMWNIKTNNNYFWLYLLMWKCNKRWMYFSSVCHLLLYKLKFYWKKMYFHMSWIFVNSKFPYFVLDTSDIIHDEQNGFRKSNSTIDHLRKHMIQLTGVYCLEI